MDAWLGGVSSERKEPVDGFAVLPHVKENIVHLDGDLLDWAISERKVPVDGLTVIPVFITIDEEKALLKGLGELPDASWSTALSRRTLHYGFRYNYGRTAPKALLQAPAVPAEYVALAAKLGFDTSASKLQVIVNEYKPGQSIAAHVDDTDLFGPKIATLSLGVSCPMKFKHTITGDSHEVELPRRSVAVLAGDARYKWSHAIRNSTRNAGTRYSITFRNIATIE